MRIYSSWKDIVVELWVALHCSSSVLRLLVLEVRTWLWQLLGILLIDLIGVDELSGWILLEVLALRRWLVPLTRLGEVLLFSWLIERILLVGEDRAEGKLITGKVSGGSEVGTGV